MYRPTDTTCSLKVKGISNMLRRESERDNTVFRIDENGNGNYIIGGNEVTEVEFDVILPRLPLINKSKGGQLNGRSIK